MGSRKTLVVWTAGIQTLLTFLGQARGNNFVRFTLSLAAVNFVVNLAAPYLAVYLLGELRYGYLTYTAVILAGSMVGMLAGPWWARFGDRFGNQVVIRWTILGESILPLFWAIFQEPAVIMLLQMAGGFLWAGLNLVSGHTSSTCRSAARDCPPGSLPHRSGRP